MDIKSKVLSFINNGETTKSLKVTKHHGAIDYEELHLTQIFTWAQIETSSGVKGWVASHFFVSNIYSQPTFNLWNFDTYDNADHVYNLGWSKDGKYYAYIVSGYIDGGLDGLTVRFYVINTSNNQIENEVVSYTSYDKPIDDAWKNDYCAIQSALYRHGIIQDTNVINMNPMPLKDSKGIPVSINFEVTDTVTRVNASYLIANTEIAAINQYRASIYCIGWMKCPYDKNKYIVYTTSNIGPSEYYVQAFAVDLKMFKK